MVGSIFYQVLRVPIMRSMDKTLPQILFAGSGSSNRRNVLVIVLVTVGAFVCIVAIFIYCLWRRMNGPGIAFIKAKFM